MGNVLAGRGQQRACSLPSAGGEAEVGQAARPPERAPSEAAPSEAGLISEENTPGPSKN